MTPKEKATYYIEKYGYKTALIVLDEIIQFGNQAGIREPMMYWNRVRYEIKTFNQKEK